MNHSLQSPTAERFLLCDADSILWKATLAALKDGEFDGQSYDTSGLLNSALCNFSSRVNSLMDCSGIHRVYLCMSGAGNFRKSFMPTYKSHRPPPPALIGEARSAILREYTNVLTWPGLEGDDVVGMHSDIPGAVIWSEDKDLLQLPGIHWGGGEYFVVTQEEAMRFFYTQVLAGDTTDGYKGCPKIGTSKAHNLTRDVPVEDLWDLTCLTYELHGSNEAVAYTNAVAAWLLRTGPGGVQVFIPPKRRSKPFGTIK